jgi:catechol-2,3-dioxygenase
MEPGGVPAHGARGAGHVALDVPTLDALEEWRAHLAVAGVEVEHEHAWPSGGRSLYFRDPEGNSLELITRGTWGF